MKPPNIAKMDRERLVKKKFRAKREGNTRQFAEATNGLADIYFQEENHNDALDEYLELVEAYETLGDRLNLAIAHRMIGEILTESCKYKEALKHLNLYLVGAREAGSKLEEQRAEATLGRTYWCLAESLPEKSEDKMKALVDAKKAYNTSINLCKTFTTKDIQEIELMTMRGRLLLNQGQVLEALSDPDAGIDLIERSIKICSRFKLNEDLHRAHLALAALYEKQGRLEKVFEHIDLAAKVESFSSKGESLLTKAELLLRTGEWTEARKVLVPLYQDKKLSKKISEQVEKSLRIAVTLCRGEERLNSDTSEMYRFKLYEDMGDAATEVRCFTKALEYYREMLSNAENNKSDTEIAAALFSLAQTAEDLGRYEEALIFGKRELSLCTDPKEASRSAQFLANLMETAGYPGPEIREVYELALAKAEASGNPLLVETVLKDYLDHLKKENSNTAGEIEERLERHKQTYPDLESEKETCEGRDIGADIVLEELSDLEQTVEERARPSRPRSTRKKGFAIKTNEKGETPLHLACINGQIERVEKLLEAGHPTQIRDNCGWTSLHEAANHGYVEIAQLLIAAGALIDDPGGPDCGGLTPLLDAAICGEIAVMNLLIDKGADIYAKTASGDTTLDCIEDWRKRAHNVSEADENEYRVIRAKLISRGVQRRREKSTEKAENRVQKRNRNALIDSEGEEEPGEPANISAGEDYKRTIAVLRNRGLQPNTSTKSVAQRVIAPLIDSEEVLEEEWLDDDLGFNWNKRTNTVRDPLQPVAKRKPEGSGPIGERESKRPKIRIPREDSFFDEEESSDSISAEMDVVTEPKKIRRSKKKQSSLLSAGFSRLSTSRTPSPIVEPSEHIEMVLQSPLEDVSFQVRVEEKVVKLRLSVSEKQKITAERVVGETQKKYEEDTGCTPIFELMTPSGEPIGPQDDLGGLFTLQNEAALTTRLTKMEIPPISERYRRICAACNVAVQEGTNKCLKTCENTSIFRLKGRDTTDEEIPPLLKSLEYQIRLQVLYLSQGSFNSCGKILSRCLSGLSSLQELHLRCSDIDAACLSKIVKFPMQIRVLDLSYNPLRSSGAQLHRLLSPLMNLQTLSLCNCELDKISPGTTTPALTNLDISWNPIDGESLRPILQPHMLSLNLSGVNLRNCVAELLSHQGFSLATLETLELSSCDLGDSELVQILLQTSNLSRISVNGNPRLSKRALTQILKRRPSLAHVDISGCSEIEEPPDLNGDVIPEISRLVVSMKPEVRESWLALWGGEGRIQSLPHNVVTFLR